MKQDLVTEMAFGEGSFRTVGKIVLCSTRAVVGVLAELPECVGDNWEMWECSIIIQPMRKRKMKEPWSGRRVDQILTGGFADEQYGKPFFSTGQIEKLEQQRAKNA